MKNSRRRLPRRQDHFVRVRVLPSFPTFFHLFGDDFPRFGILTRCDDGLLFRTEVMRPCLRRRIMVVRISATPTKVVPIIRRSCRPLPHILRSNCVLIGGFLRQIYHGIRLIFDVLNVRRMPIYRDHRRIRFRQRVVNRSHFQRSTNSNGLRLAYLLMVRLYRCPRDLFRCFVPINGRVFVSVNFLLQE